MVETKDEAPAEAEVVEKKEEAPVEAEVKEEAKEEVAPETEAEAIALIQGTICGKTIAEIDALIDGSDADYCAALEELPAA